MFSVRWWRSGIVSESSELSTPVTSCFEPCTSVAQLPDYVSDIAACMSQSSDVDSISVLHAVLLVGLSTMLIIELWTCTATITDASIAPNDMSAKSLCTRPPSQPVCVSCCNAQSLLNFRSCTRDRLCKFSSLALWSYTMPACIPRLVEQCCPLITSRHCMRLCMWFPHCCD